MVQCLRVTAAAVDRAVIPGLLASLEEQTYRVNG